MTIETPALDTIRRHAAEAYPNECCGALIGAARPDAAGAKVIEAHPLPNATREGTRRRFLVHPDQYRAAERRARDAGAALVGFYHSHPDAPARPSQYDLDNAWPNLSYIIVAVAAGLPGELRSWRLRDDRSAFEEEALTCPLAF